VTEPDPLGSIHHDSGGPVDQDQLGLEGGAEGDRGGAALPVGVVAALVGGRDDRPCLWVAAMTSAGMGRAVTSEAPVSGVGSSVLMAGPPGVSGR
jgi:hypothetical protein